MIADPETPVNLFQQNHPHELMGKGHFGKTKLIIRPFQHRRRQSKGTSSSIVWGKDSDLMFYEMYGLDFDDPKWDELLDKMTLEEAQYLVVSLQSFY